MSSSGKTSSSSKSGGSSQERSSSRSKDDSSSSKEKDKKDAKPKARNATELRAREEREYLEGLMDSHAGYLKPIIISLSNSFGLTLKQTAIALALIYFGLHLITPAFLLPHLSALVTLIIPVRATLSSITIELDEKRGAREAKNSAQWCVFWAVYGMLEISRGWTAIWKPGWKPVFEITRTGCLVAVGGPWFGAKGLRPPGDSEELKKMEKEENAKAQSKQAKQAKKDKKDKGREKR